MKFFRMRENGISINSNPQEDMINMWANKKIFILFFLTSLKDVIFYKAIILKYCWVYGIYRGDIYDNNSINFENRGGIT